MCGEYRISGLPVVDADQRLLGIITNRDLRFVPVAEWATTKVDEVMTPMPLITAPVGISRDDATALLRQHKRERLPLVDDAGPARRADHRQGLREVRAVPATRPRTRTAGCWSAPRSATSATPGSGRPRWSTPGSTCSSPTPPTATSRLLLDMVAPAQDRPGHPARPGASAATSRPAPGAQAFVDAGADAVKVGVGPGLDLHHPRRHRGRRPAGHRGLRGGAGLQAGRRPGHRRRRAAVLRRHRQGDRRRRRHGDGRLAAGRLRGVARRPGLRQRQAVQVLPRHGLARGDELARQEVLLQGPLLPGRGRPATTRSCPRASRARSPTAGRSSAVAHQLVGGLRQSMFYVGARTIAELGEKGRFVRITAGRAQGVAPARHPDDRRGAELLRLTRVNHR